MVEEKNHFNDHCQIAKSHRKTIKQIEAYIKY